MQAASLRTLCQSQGLSYILIYTLQNMPSEQPDGGVGRDPSSGRPREHEVRKAISPELALHDAAGRQVGRGGAITMC